MKWCNGCGTSKPEDAFYKRSTGILCSSCKECCSEHSRQYRATHKAEYTATHRRYKTTHRTECAARDRRYKTAHREQCAVHSSKYFRAHPAEARAGVQRWRTAHPGANRAHSQVQCALKTGELVKSPFCQLCLDGEHVLDAHHYNGLEGNEYDHPLDIVWLCRICHKGLHAIGRKEN